MTLISCGGITPLKRDRVGDEIKKIEADILVGMSASDVKKYFESHDIKYSFHLKNGLDSYYIDGNDVKYDANVKGSYYATIPIKRGGVVNTDIFIFIPIDNDDSVSSVVVRPIYTGP